MTASKPKMLIPPTIPPIISNSGGGSGQTRIISKKLKMPDTSNVS